MAGDGSSPAGEPPPVTVEGSVGQLPSRLRVEDAATACVAIALGAAAAVVRADEARPGLAVDRRDVAAAVTSERHFRSGSGGAMGFATLSRFWRCADGWVRTHTKLSVARDGAAAGARHRRRCREARVGDRIDGGRGRRGGRLRRGRRGGGRPIRKRLVRPPSGSGDRLGTPGRSRGDRRGTTAGGTRRGVPLERRPGARSDARDRRAGVHTIPRRTRCRRAACRPSTPS